MITQFSWLLFFENLLVLSAYSLRKVMLVLHNLTDLSIEVATFFSFYEHIV